MKRILFSIIVLALVCSCKNRGAYKVDNDIQKYIDSLAQINLVRQQDSIERERIFAALGDTVFGTVRYGMSKIQARLAINKFEKSLKDKNGSGFVFDGYRFLPMDNFVDIEYLRKDYIKYYPSGYTPGCEPFMRYMKEFKYNNRIKFFRGGLYSICWESVYEYGENEYVISEKVAHLIKLFEKKYGKCTEKDLQLCNYFGKIINGKKVIVMGRLAYWEACNKTIEIYLEEIEIDERVYDKDLPFKYMITIQFQDIINNNKANKFIDDVMKAEKTIEREKFQEDSVKSANAL